MVKLLLGVASNERFFHRVRRAALIALAKVAPSFAVLEFKPSLSDIEHAMV